MGAPESVSSAYARVRPLLNEAQRYVRDTLAPYARDHSYLFIDRVKDVESLTEKLEGGRYRSWSDVDDLYACTVVVPTSEHEEAVLAKLRSVFVEVKVRSRSDSQKAPDVFRFDGVRWYGRIQSDLAHERQPGLSLVLFEIQVITAFEWAWTRVTHDLVYKGENVDWRRLRLAAQLKAAVEQIEVLISSFSAASEAVLSSPWPPTDAAQMIVDRFKTLDDEGLIPQTIHPASWRRFAENVVALVRSYSRDPSRLGSATERLMSVIELDLRSKGASHLPVSGTLFQYVVSIVARDDTDGHLRRFAVVPSSEYGLFYSLLDIPVVFEFNGLSTLETTGPDQDP